MKVFFTASQRGKQQFSSYYKKIAEEIEKNGYTLFEDDILTQNPDEFYRRFERGDKKAFAEFYEKELKCLQEADINIFDCSFHSLSIGFIIEKSLELNKPTVILYWKKNTPFFLTGAQNKKLFIRNYDEKNLSKTINEVLSLAREQRDKRFNFFISPQLLSYLEDVSKKENITKSQLIRNLIVEHKRKTQTS